MKAILLLVIIAGADEPKSPNTLVCEVVRWYVSEYGEPAAMSWAKSHGWSKARIDEARRCIQK